MLGWDADDTYYSVRAIERVLPPGVRWQDALMAEMYGATEKIRVAI